MGERRTEPPATMKSMTTAAGNPSSHVHGSGCSHGSDIEGVVGGVEKAAAASDKPDDTTEKPRARFAAMDISLEAENPSLTPVPNEIDNSPVNPKKERRKVAFMQHDQPELYDF